MEENFIHSYLSNRVELLTEVLAELIEKNNHSTPFAHRLIIVSNSAMQAWLKERLTKLSSQKIATGFRIVPLLSAIDSLQKWLYQQNHFVPNSWGLALAIERQLRNILEDAKAPQTNDIWNELLQYLMDSSPLPPAIVNKRLAALSEELAALFLRYGEYAPQLIDKWRTSPPTSWQAALWLRLFNTDSPWRPLAELLSPQKKPIPPVSPIQLHLFAIDHLSDTVHSFFSHISQVVSVTYYLLSPCQFFWSDIASDREKVRLQKYWQRRGAAAAQLEQLELYLHDNNPLLANWGRIARAQAMQLEQKSLITYEQYRLPAATSTAPAWSDILPLAEKQSSPSVEPFTLLEALHADMLVLRCSATTPLSLPKQEKSLQVHCCCSPMREVEVAYDIVHELIAAGMCPSDLLIVAPNISCYAPYIEALFSPKQDSVPYQLIALPAPLRSPFIPAFFRLLDLPLGRWDTAAVMELFEQPAFRRRHAITSDTIARMREWLKQTHTHWGFDDSHRHALLMRDGCQATIEQEDSCLGTWQMAMERLAASLAVSDVTGHPIALIEEINLLDAEALGACAFVLVALRKQLFTIEIDQQQNIATWVNYLIELLHDHLTPDPESSSDKEGQQCLLNAFEQLQRCNPCEANALFPFSSLRRQLELLVNNCSLNVHNNILKSVRCANIETLSGLPAQAIICLGMDEGAFPRRETLSCLNLFYSCKHSKANFCPSVSDRDRHLFLRLLLSARRYFIATYCGYETDGKQRSPSVLLTELLHYLDQGYRIEEQLPSQRCFYHHPFVPFDRRCFSAASLHRGASQRWFLCVKAALEHLPATSNRIVNAKPEEGRLPRFFADTAPSKAIKEDQTSLLEVDIRELITLVRNPLQLYFNKSLKIYIESKKKEGLMNESFALTALEEALLTRSAVKDNANSVLRAAHKEGRLPIGSLKYIAKDKVYGDSMVWKEKLQQLGVDPTALFNVVLCSSCSCPEQLLCGGWRLPPLVFKDASGGAVRLIGTISNLSAQGSITYIKDDKKQISRAWPEYLVVCGLAHRGFIPPMKQAHLLLAKSGNSKKPFFEDPFPLLDELLHYYRHAIQAPSPLLPEWIAELLEGGPELFASQRKKQLTNSFCSLYNDYLIWASKGSLFSEAELWGAQWQGIATATFGPLFQAWYPSTS